MTGQPPLSARGRKPRCHQRGTVLRAGGFLCHRGGRRPVFFTRSGQLGFRLR
jgi:hypothetical protein